MDSRDPELVNKCENLMNIVVESRKRFGKMCVEYEQKSAIIENKIINSQIETFSNYKFKPKHPVPPCKNEDLKYLDEISVEMSKHSKCIEDLRQRIKNTQEVVAQLKRGGIVKPLPKPLTAERLLLTTDKNTAH